jgi:MerR family redox-sensitive transcriptional activator SoxR
VVHFQVEEPTLTISEVARQAGMNPSAIRYYERVGVLPKPDRLGGHRRYTPETVRKLQVVDLAKRSGFTLDQVKELLRSDRPRDVLNAMAERKLPAVQALAERASAMQASATDGEQGDTGDLCGRFAQSIELLTAPPGEPPDEP